MKKVFLLVMACLITSSSFAQERPKKPNVVLILTDDLGWQDVKCYDIDEPSPFETPNIDKLATEGVLFWQAYSAATVCSPSRGAILSGKHPVRLERTSVRGGHPPLPFNYGSSLISPWMRGALDTSEVTIAESLKTNGYKTGHSGKWHVGIAVTDYPEPKDQGFDFSKHGFGSHKRMEDRTKGFSTADKSDPFYLDEEGFPFDDITQDGIDFMDGNKKDPFFLFYASRLVHTPIHTRSEALLKKYYQKLGIDYPKEKDLWEEKGQRNAYYAAMVETIDHYTGLLIKYLEQTEDPRWPGHMLIENTYVIFTSDNGGMEQHTGEIITDNYPLDKGKINAKEGGTRVPFIVKGPTISSNIESNVMVNGLDLYPTILSWTGTQKEDNQILDGADLSTLLDKDPTDAKLVIDTETGAPRNTMMWHFPNSSMQSTLRVDDYKLVRQYTDTEKKATLELYQLYENGLKRVDIEESKNLATQMPEKAKEMDLLLKQRLEKLNARYPFLNPTSKAQLPNKAKIPTVVKNGVDGKEVWLEYKNNGAKVVKAELIYTKNGGVKGEIWFPITMRLIGNKVCVKLPKGTTHYVFNLVDENNFLISYPDAGYQKTTKIFATKAIQVK
ncbi:sulfatase [Wenyingzhuangia sp. 2_MG-2023]|uniref:sulfatase n=1 Tax=Wenyingzhuangia sp. 2_MG-2023 TaxID=3062639 RepID=UPI0026E346A0|nr:sulfatase [Wenyingzhuangia sp. 2_MG-2023]MDO6736288.1 sulfatase [Wenyingzhuangia sp. 2_MG-2023]MDO6801408.1 sulfatase [Wenyingzhuangia sp. 1_MG-2023]